jgi:UDP-N-acetyl-2-amino-2-deoxyglucuronate dehydrogenase
MTAVNMHPIGVGIIGTGNIAEHHVRALQQVDGAQLLACYSRASEKNHAFAQRFRIEPASTLEALLQRVDVQIVTIATPTGTHADIAIRALAAGKNVLCEKPLEINLQRVDAMLVAAERHHRLLGAVFQSRFGEGAQQLKRAIDQGRFGRLTLCDAYVKWWRTQDYYDSGAWRGTWDLDGGGALMNQGIHAVDLLQWLVGMPEEVSAQMGTLAHQRVAVEDTLVAQMRFAAGGLGVIEAATSVWPGFQKRIEISGERGSAVLQDDRLVSWQFAVSCPEDEAIRQQGQKPTQVGGGVANPMAFSYEGHRIQFQDFVDAVREGRTPAISGHEARNAVRLVTAIYTSCRTGRKVLV